MKSGWAIGVVAVSLLVVAAGAVVVAVITSSADGTNIVDLDVGDCFDLPSGDSADGPDDGIVESVDVVDCATPHLAEVVALGSLNDDDAAYPSDAELFADVERACRAADAVESAAFGLLPIAPTRKLWDSFDGRYLCVAVPFGGEPVTGSALAG